MVGSDIRIHEILVPIRLNPSSNLNQSFELIGNRRRLVQASIIVILYSVTTNHSNLKPPMGVLAAPTIYMSCPAGPTRVERAARCTSGKRGITRRTSISKLLSLKNRPETKETSFKQALLWCDPTGTTVHKTHNHKQDNISSKQIARTATSTRPHPPPLN